MQLRSRNVTNDQSTPKPPDCTVTRKPTTRPAKPMVCRSPSDEDDIVPLSENGVRHAIRFADQFMETNHTSLHAHFVADGKRLYRRWQECERTTRSGAHSKRTRQNEFEAFVRFVQQEAGVDITDDVTS